jgi:hypothetical protein
MTFSQRRSKFTPISNLCLIVTEIYAPDTTVMNYKTRVDYFYVLITSVAEPHHFYAAPAPDPAPGKNFFDAAPAPAPTLMYSKTKFLKRTKV